MDQGEFEKLQSQVAAIQAQVDGLKQQLDSNRSFSEQMAEMLGIQWQKDLAAPFGQPEEDKKTTKGKKRKAKLKCSFCSKSEDDVKKLIAGPGVFICNECVELCSEILEDELVTQAGGAPSKLPTTMPDQSPDKSSGFQSSGFHSSVRSFVLDAVVVQAMAGAAWKEVCAEVMQASSISQEEVESEMVKMRNSMKGYV